VTSVRWNRVEAKSRCPAPPSGAVRGGYDFNAFADDRNAVIEHLDLHQMTLVGQSTGCGEVVRYLSRHGATRVERIVLIGTVTPFFLKTLAACR
jgi:pimeloyl-ACP methyl ester carboxylesterase